MKRLIVIGIITALTIQMMAQDFRQTQMIHELDSKTEAFFEGFDHKVIPNKFNYHSFRHDVGASMITRCLEMPSPMVWKTELVPMEYNESHAGFLWIAAIDLSDEGASFTVSFNGEKRFTIVASNNKDWVLQGDSGGTMKFHTMMIDRHNDAHGYMTMEVPLEWLKQGEAQEIRIEGNNSNQSTWIIVYGAKDAKEFMTESTGFSRLYSMTTNLGDPVHSLVVQTARALTGTQIRVESDDFVRKHELILTDGLAQADIRIPKNKLGQKITLFDDRGEILSWDFGSEQEENSILMAEGVLKNQFIEISESEFVVIAKRDYMPGLVNSILELSESSMGKSQILLMNSSHQDIACMDSPEKCVVERDTMLLQPLFNRAEIDPDYRFDIEDALMIKEYVQRHPEKKELVGELLRSGRISCGATFIQPYEEMYSGEALARQFYFGAKWLKDEFNYVADTYWNVDVPGRTLQMPQMMKKAGVNNLVMTRQELGFYHWYSPDGSRIIGFSNGHYGDSYGPLGDEYYIASDYLSTYSSKWAPFYTNESVNPVVPVLSDWDMSPAKDYSNLLTSWNSLKELKTKNGIVPVSLPDFKEALAPDMFKALRASNPVLPEIHGERPALWLYIHGPSHQKAQKASRKADILLTQVEKLATVNALLDNSFTSYPAHRLNKAWESKIFPDHGWGGKMGLITDAYFKSKYDFALSEASEMMNIELRDLGSRIKLSKSIGRPVLVFNSLSWERTSPVVYSIIFNQGEAKNVQVVSAKGEIIPSQMNNKKLDEDGFLLSADIHFIAEKVPSVGYKTYYLKAIRSSKAIPMPKQGKRIENTYYVVEIGQGGIKSIFDKEEQQELLHPDGFTAGEVFTLRSVGNGAGEFDQVQQADTSGFDKTGNYRTQWKLVEDGSVFTAYSYRQAIRNAVVEQKIIMYKNLKKIDFEIAVLNWEGILYREYRMALPVKGENSKVVYEVPY
ncbi:MAG: hypothetical protein HOK84_06410, partial [Bacteroidetes bacterium]|nr:hypothetical protein [Bacteroidota bacterium]